MFHPLLGVPANNVDLVLLHAKLVKAGRGRFDIKGASCLFCHSVYDCTDSDPCNIDGTRPPRKYASLSCGHLNLGQRLFARIDE